MMAHSNGFECTLYNLSRRKANDDNESAYEKCLSLKGFLVKLIVTLLLVFH